MDFSTDSTLGFHNDQVVVPVSITKVKKICRAVINPIQLLVMSVSLCPASSSATAAFLYLVSYILELFL